jgi:septal ring factor EnvC (AmiA/AmiB activator)
MTSPLRRTDGESDLVREREVFERLGHARSDVERAEQAIVKLRARHHDLLRQVEVVEAENRALERDLMQKLATWRRLDDGAQRVDEALPTLRAVTGSLTYRITERLLIVLNRARFVLGFRWLRKHPW